ncbi:FAD-dependent oxidoreductase [Spirulina sp. CS-785/01]|uniref:dihydrolipoyl dehydrogenase family protein n=1 Tax=Spirulina sp. CS-785/01 TaxID=3021716 RepID=UPI00232F4A6D|nr:FAD-dependent oxidoreductase [Spirulina sp. CS-785/01]MDB9311936.1 FAD-dependent oxidoreductase [Spirulina sp. CS-785/01]
MAVEYDIVIIGGGSGGLVVASAAAQLNAKVALVEKDKLGGDCLWYGCVPSKSLIHAARVAYDVKHGSRFGIYTDPPEIKFKEALGHVHRAIKAIEPHDSPERFRSLGVEVIFGLGQFIDQNTFEVEGRKLTARSFVVSTGSRPAIPPVPGLQEAGFLTNEQIFSIEKRPDALAIIGGGPIGCELGQAFHRLGSKVTIFSSREHILPKEDPEAAVVVEQQLESEGITILNHSRAERVEVVNGKKYIYSGDQKIAVDEILVSSGRTPNVDSLNLEAAGVDYDKKGIKVNQALQTTNSRIFACGDVIGGYQFTHVAGYEAVYALTNALFSPIKQFFPSKVDYRVIPWATFTEPELARVGLTEKQARDRYGHDIHILKQPFAGVDRAQAEAATEGFAKFITTGKGKILGAHMVGPSAGELIHEVVLAMKHKLPVSALTGIHIYPTLSEVNSKAGLLLKKENFAQNTFLQAFLRKFFNFLRG